MAVPPEPTYFVAFPALAGVYLEDSWVLDVSPSETGCVFRLEAVLTPDHPLYRSPRPGEQHCYLDATDERDWGNIDGFEAVDWEGRHAWSLHGAWGELTSVEPVVGLALGD